MSSDKEKYQRPSEPAVKPAPGRTHESSVDLSKVKCKKPTPSKKGK